MQRSSDGIASLAAALAKAQGELVNPEKSLTATIRSDGSGGGEQTFNYASLASGLDIVRKTLGKHEIATMQTTAIDQAAGMVNLRTVLAHSSGEWIASDWPVCPISDTATPHRMGAALTYARRYALFTLVGIAGEDDLDAPDVAASAQQPSQPPTPKRSSDVTHWRADARSHKDRRATDGRGNGATPCPEPEALAKLRDRLLAELSALTSSDEAALWAHRSLPQKDRLTAADAQRVEDAFQAKMALLPGVLDQTDSPSGLSGNQLTADPTRSKHRPRARAVDKSALSLPEPRRVRDREHVRFVASKPCLRCGRMPSDAHHLRFAQSRALGRKVSDEFTVPLCRGHHREVHQCGDEVSWWARAGLDPISAARELWLETHPLAV
jgi:ERF superfamily